MNSFTWGLCCAAALAVAQSHAETANSYQLIAHQNAFRLRPPTPVETRKAEQIDLPKILLTGLSTIDSSRKALFQAETGPGKNKHSYILEEGQSADGIQVVRIDEKARRVTFNNNGTMQQLGLEIRTQKPGVSSLPKPDHKVPPVTGIPAPEPAMSPEAQIVMIEVERERTREQVERGELPALPPTELTLEGSAGVPPN